MCRATRAVTISLAVTRQSAAHLTVKRTVRLPDAGSVNDGRASGCAIAGGGGGSVTGGDAGGSGVGCAGGAVGRPYTANSVMSRNEPPKFSRRITRTNRTPAAPSVGANSVSLWRAADVRVPVSAGVHGPPDELVEVST